MLGRWYDEGRLSSYLELARDLIIKTEPHDLGNGAATLGCRGSFSYPGRHNRANQLQARCPARKTGASASLSNPSSRSCLQCCHANCHAPHSRHGWLGLQCVRSAWTAEPRYVSCKISVGFGISETDRLAVPGVVPWCQGVTRSQSYDGTALTRSPRLD